MRLAKKTALITGGSRGIGRGIALKLASEGVRVGVHYFRNKQAAEDTLALVKANGADGFLVQADITDPAAISRLFEEVRTKVETLDIFVSNARPEVVEFFYPPMDITLDQWDVALNSQAKAFLVATREAAKLLNDNGRVIAITYAMGGRTGSLQPWVAMGCAKSALETLMRYFAVTLAGRGVTVNAVSPGWTDDSVLNTLPQQVQNLMKGWHEGGWTPMGRLGTPADIGNVVSLLCSDEAGWITGQVIYADGGSSLMNPEVAPEVQLPPSAAPR